MSAKSEYRNACIETLEAMANEGDIQAMVILIEEDIHKKKWLDTLANIVRGADKAEVDDYTRELMANEQKKAAVQLLKLTKKMSDDEELSMESINKIRDLDGF